MKNIVMYLDDILLLAGCGCVLYGLSLWNVVITWIAAGAMLIGAAVLVGKVKGKNAAK